MSRADAEEKFRAVVRQALVDSRIARGEGLLDIFSTAVDDYTDSVVGSLKLDDWWIHPVRGILVVEDYDWVEWEDGSDQWDIWTINEGDDDE